jgi:hypothetical protein
MTQTRSWTLALAPRRAGDLEIPALSLGGSRSRPIPIQVLSAAQAEAQGGAPKPILVETELDTRAPYVQQAFEYRVRVLFREQPRRAVLSDPEAEGATIESAGEDQSFTKEIGGQRYTAIERRYRVIPQRSGPLTIRSPRLEADLPDTRPGARRSPFGDLDSLFGGRVFQDFPAMPDLGTGRRVIERGPEHTVEVRPQPDGTGPHWLPAESIQLADEWTPSPPHPRVGEPLTRTLTITARGVAAAQLPTLEPGAPQGANLYPETPQGEDLPGSGNGPASVKTLKLALVPTRAGALTLPEIRLPWWDTKADQARVATIPARTLQVESAPAGSAAARPAESQAASPRVEPQLQAPSAAAPETAHSAPPAAAGSAAPPSPPSWLPHWPPRLGDLLGEAGPWPPIALVLGLGWLITLGWLIRERHRLRGAPAAQPRGAVAERRGESQRAAAAALRRACADSDPRAARAALLAWGRSRWNGAGPKGLGELAERLGDGTAREALADLDRAVYAQGGLAWDGPAAWQRLKPLIDAQAQGREGRATPPLPELYPRGV